jgi:hypothetical protein
MTTPRADRIRQHELPLLNPVQVVVLCYLPRLMEAARLQ